MDNPQDCLVTSSQDVISISCPSTSGNSTSNYLNKHGRKRKPKTANEQFPWFLSFQNLCRSVLGSTSMKDLLHIINVYTEHVSRDVVASYSKPNRAAKLKTNMISMLGFFHNCYVSMKEPFDEAAYLQKMSNLLTMYFDMEVKASRRGKESVKRITSKLISALFIFLNNSAEYILDAILKARFTVKSYSEICIPIFKMVTNLPQSQEMNYVRCLFVFKLWKRMLPCREERNSINRLAVAKLSPPPAQVLEFIRRGLLSNVLPTPPPDKKPPLITRFYMTKKFNLRESIKAFLKMEAELKLNDFTSALDSIRLLDDDEDAFSMENFEQDYSLLESIWIDISNSPVSPDHSSLSSPSTSGSAPLDVAFNRSSGSGSTSRVLESNTVSPSKVRKSLFKPKSPKKNKQQKNKAKDKSKNNKEDLVIDLCKEYEENCSDITQNDLRNLKSGSTSTSKSQVYKKILPSQTAHGVCANKQELDGPVSSENILEENSSKDINFCGQLNEEELSKSNLKHESKMVIKNLIMKSEVSIVSKPHPDSVSQPQVCDILSSSVTAVSTSSTNMSAPPPPSILDVNSSKNLNCELEGKNHENVKLDQESKVETKAITRVLVPIKDFNIPPIENYDMVTDSNSVTDAVSAIKAETSVLDVNSIENLDCKLEGKNHENVKLDQESKVETKAITRVLVPIKDFNIPPIENYDMVTDSNSATDDVSAIKVETSVNKILISCKNFSKIGFKHEESGEKLLNEEPKELTSSMEIVEDAVLKTKSFKENSLHLKNDELSSKQLLEDNIEHDAGANKISKRDYKSKTSPKAPIQTQSVCNKDIRSTRVNEHSEIDSGPKPITVKESFCEKGNNLNEKETPVQIEEPAEPATISHINDVFTVDDFARKMCYKQNDLKKTKRTEVIGNKSNNKTIINREKEGQRVDPVNKSQVETSLTSEINLVVPEVNIPKLKIRKIQDSLGTTHKVERGENLTSGNNSNKESSEVSSSSFEDSNQIEPSNLPLNPLLVVENQESNSCKVEKELSKLSACMKNAESSLGPLNSKIKEKCDKNTQVPSEESSYSSNKPSYVVRPPSLPIPKNDQLKQPSNNPQKEGLNTCLLYKILGDDDCLKNVCLLKNSVPEKLPQEFAENNLPEVALKQELENSSELPSENATSTIPSLWNPAVGIKLEKDHENSRNPECVEGIRNNSDFWIKSVTEACNFRELDYDCESDCEDRNLVIDEDIDSVKDHNEIDPNQLDIQSKCELDCVKHNTNNSADSYALLTNNNNHLNDIGQKLLCEIPDAAINQQDQQILIDNLKSLEDKSLKKKLAGKHKLPKIVESNMKTSLLRSSYNNEASIDSSVKYRSLSNSEVMFAENNTPYVPAQHYRGENSSINRSVLNHYTQPTIIKRPDGDLNIGRSSPSCRRYLPYPTSHVNSSGNIRSKNRDPRLNPDNVNSSSYLQKSNISVQSNVNVQSQQIKTLEGSLNQPHLSSEIANAASPIPAPSSNHFEAYNQYNMVSKMSVPSCQNSSSGERFCQRSPVGNDKYRSLDKIQRTRDSPVRKFQESSLSNTSHTNHSPFAEGTNMTDNSNPSYHKYNMNESQNIKTGEAIYENNNLLGDPLCLVKNKEDPREMYDFEFNVFPIAQEVEICSGSENLVGEWLYPLSSEIGHPDWPIANEQNVIDSSLSYSQPPDQYMFSTVMKNDQGCSIIEADQPCYIPLEIQQIDNRPPNIVGKNINKEKLNLHLRTLEGDCNLCCSQGEFKEFYLSRDVSPTIPVPFPPIGRTDNSNSSVRCPCEQCSDNQQKLLSNYNVLTHFRNSKLKPLNVFPSHTDEASFSEKDQSGEFDSSLPLKKRKTMTNSKVTEEVVLPSYPNTPIEEVVLPSYPNTPMISIAQLELTGYEQGNQVIVPNPQSQWRDSVAYNALNLVQPPSLEPYDGQAKGKRRASKRRKSSR